MTRPRHDGRPCAGASEAAAPTKLGAIQVTFVQHFWDRLGGLPQALAIGLAILATACGSAAVEPPATVVRESSGNNAVATLSDPEGSQSKGQPTPTVSEPDGSQGMDQPTLAASEPTPAVRFSDLGPAPGIEPDPDYKEALENSGLSTGGWDTDFSLHSVAYDEIISGGVPRDGIPPLDSPSFAGPDDADAWLGNQEPVISFELNGEAKAYPLQILTWHEIVNDEVGGVPVIVTFCPLCNSAIVFDRRLDGVVLDFGTSGRLRNSDLIMWDRQTESWWQQLTGEAIIGKLTGHTLEFLPAPIVSWADFKAAHPTGQVLSQETGFGRSYGRNPYAGYDEVGKPPFLFFGDLDGRLLPKERVVAFTLGGMDVAIPFSALEKEGVVNYSVGDSDIAVFFKKGTTSALDLSSIRDSRDVGAAAVFDANLDGRKLTFASTDATGDATEMDGFRDSETGSSWNILGQGTAGPLAGANLTPVVHANHFWFAWAAFKPDTLIYQGADFAE